MEQVSGSWKLVYERLSCQENRNPKTNTSCVFIPMGANAVALAAAVVAVVAVAAATVALAAALVVLVEAVHRIQFCIESF